MFVYVLMSVTASFTGIVESLLFTERIALCEQITWGQKKFAISNFSFKLTVTIVSSTVRAQKLSYEEKQLCFETSERKQGIAGTLCPPVHLQGRGETVHVCPAGNQQPKMR